MPFPKPHWNSHVLNEENASRMVEMLQAAVTAECVTAKVQPIQSCSFVYGGIACKREVLHHQDAHALPDASRRHIMARG